MSGNRDGTQATDRQPQASAPDATGSARADELRRALLAIRNLRQQVQDFEARQREPIAIISMACRLPGGAETPELFWELLRNGVDATVEVPPERWNIDELYDPDLDKAGRMYTRRGAFLRDPVDRFDAAFFGISPREAAAMDPSQRLLLELSWEALERAGIPPLSLGGSDTGVFIGMSGSDYDTLQTQSSTLTEVHTYRGTGTAPCVASGRISYVLGLNGPNLTVDTACSSSLVAVVLAVESLRAGRCRLALAGASHMILAPESTVYLCRMRALSPGGRCRTFDADADGYARGEGGGMFALKRLSDAVADGDPVLAVIRGAAYNHDGHSSGLTVPNPAAQRAVIQAALDNGGLAPADVDYVEAHGTATPLGDPIEIRAMADVLGRGRPSDRPLLIGSVKTNIGHLEAAAGATGLMKIALSMGHGELPPHLHCPTPTPHVDWDRIPVRINQELSAWTQGDRPRMAGASGFGFSGTNAHVILQDAPTVEAGARSSHAAELVVVSGRDRDALRANARRFAGAVRHADSVSLGDIALTSLVGRSPMPFRAAAVAADGASLADALEAIADAGDGAIAHVRGMPAGKTAFLFTGQGAQYPGMGRELYDNSPAARALLDGCDAILRPHLDRGLLELLLDEQDPDVIQQTMYAQPILFALEYALANLWQDRGIRPDFVAGHSLGEYVAATVAGVMSLEDALPLVALRGRLMQELPAGGRMAAVLAAENVVAAAVARVEGVSIAGLNGPDNTVVSGPADGVERVLAILAADGVQNKPLHVSHAFHSALMEPMLDRFEAAVSAVTLNAPRIPLLSNVTGAVMTAGEAVDAARWRRHIREPVRFAPSLARMYELGARTFLEVGPHPALSAMGMTAVTDSAVRWLPSMRRGRSAWQQILETTGELWRSGYEIDTAAYARDHGGRRVAAPTYAFQRERHWFTDGSGVQPSTGLNARGPARPLLHPLLGSALSSPALDGWVFETVLDPRTPAYLADHRAGGQTVVPAAAFVEMMFQAARHGPGWTAASLRDLLLHRPLMLSESGPTVCQVLVAPAASGAAAVRIVEASGSTWSTVASATMVMTPAPSTPVATAIDALRATHADAADVSTIYESIALRGVEYGPEFTTLISAWTTPGSALGRARLSDSTDADAYLLHPCLFDAAFHLLASITGDGTDASAAFLPSGMDSIRIHEPAGSTCWIQATLRTDNGTSADHFTADLRLLGDDGRTLASIEGFQTRRVRTRPGEAGSDRTLYGLAWEDVTDAVAEPAPHTGTWLLIGRGGQTEELLVRALERTGITCVRAGIEDLAAGTALSDAISGVIHLASTDASDHVDIDCDQDAVASEIVANCAVLIDLLAGAGDGTSLRIITRGASGPDAPAGSGWQAGAALWGALPSLRAEHPEMHPRIVDLDPSADLDPETLVALLLGDIDEDRLVMREGRVLAPRLTRGLPQPLNPATPNAVQGENYHMMPERRGTLESIRYEPASRTDPGPGEVEVRIRVTGLNFRDVLNVLGMYPGDPGAPGVEFAGIVTRTGAGVSHIATGDSVIGIGMGLFSAYAVVKANSVVSMPPHLTFEEAVTIPLAFLSAEWGLMHAGSLRAGERVLIHAATGGVGQAAVQIAQAAGAEVFATAGSDEKRALLRAQGVHHVFDSRSDSFAAGVRAATGGEGVDVVLNSLTGELLQRSLELLRPGGRFVELGAREVLDSAELARTHPGIHYDAFQLGALPLTDDEFRAMFAEVAHRFETGGLRPLRVRSFPPDRITDAFRYMAQAWHIGKVVIGAAQVSAPLVRTDGAYLVTGASGGIGRALVDWLADQGAGAIVLNSRSAPDADTSAWLEQLRERGTAAVWIGGDVSDPDDVAAMIARAAATGMTLRGVFHAAGVLDDGLLRGYDRDRSARVLAPKVRGAINLHEATRALDLDHFVLFSSTAALLGGAGQAVYGAGNAFLGVLAQARRSSGLPALCVDWGAWAGQGMAARLSARERATLEQNGLAFLEPDVALALLGRLMSHAPPRIMAADIKWDRLRSATGARPLPLVRRLLSDSTTKPDEAATDAVLDAAMLAELPDEERGPRISEYVVHAMSAVLGLRPGRLDADTALNTLGFDSLMAMELRNRIESNLGILVPVAALLQAETPSVIADAVADHSAFGEGASGVGAGEVLEAFEF